MNLADSFAHTSFSRFMNCTAGRIARIVVGLVLIILGFALGSGVAGLLLIVVGLIPLAAGTFNLCLISALLGGPIGGAKVAGNRK